MTKPLLLVLLVMTMCGCRDVSQDWRFWACYGVASPILVLLTGLVAGRMNGAK